uniref:Uncharacterized protein n=1 Tax=Arundo donax TaxID=35708 RepID=A0A0A9ARV5_ARUDO
MPKTGSPVPSAEMGSQLPGTYLFLKRKRCKGHSNAFMMSIWIKQNCSAMKWLANLTV